MSETVPIKKTVSIVGCGWLGQPLGELLVREGHRVKGSTTDREKMETLRESGIEPYYFLLDPEVHGENVRELFDADVLVLNIPPGRRRPNVEEFHPLQVKNLMEELKTSPVNLVLFISSTSVYAASGGEVMEANEEVPDSASGRALRKVEKMLGESGQFDTTVVRFGGLLGGERHPARFLAGKKDVPNPRAPVNLIHREDCLEILRQLIQREVRGEVFNGVADEHPARQEFYTEQARVLGIEPPTFSREDDGRHKVVSNAKIKLFLDYQFRYPDPRTMFIAKS